MPPEFIAEKPDAFDGPAVVTVWASWCIPCRRELPMFARAAQDFRARGLTVVALNTKDTRSAARRFLRDLKIDAGSDLVVLYDPPGRKAKDLRVTAMPTTLFLLPGGKINQRIIGPIESGRLTSEINELISRSPGGP